MPETTNQTAWKLRCFLLLALLLPSTTNQLQAQESVEFDTGRRRPTVNGLPVLGSGLAMSKGYFRGVTVGELAE